MRKLTSPEECVLLLQLSSVSSGIWCTTLALITVTTSNSLTLVYPTDWDLQPSKEKAARTLVHRLRVPTNETRTTGWVSDLLTVRCESLDTNIHVSFWSPPCRLVEVEGAQVYQSSFISEKWLQGPFSQQLARPGPDKSDIKFLVVTQSDLSKTIQAYVYICQKSNNNINGITGQTNSYNFLYQRW